MHILLIKSRWKENISEYLRLYFRIIEKRRNEHYDVHLKLNKYMV